MKSHSRITQATRALLAVSLLIDPARAARAYLPSSPSDFILRTERRFVIQAITPPAGWHPHAEMNRTASAIAAGMAPRILQVPEAPPLLLSHLIIGNSYSRQDLERHGLQWPSEWDLIGLPGNRLDDRFDVHENSEDSAIDAVTLSLIDKKVSSPIPTIRVVGLAGKEHQSQNDIHELIVFDNITQKRVAEASIQRRRDPDGAYIQSVGYHRPLDLAGHGLIRRMITLLVVSGQIQRWRSTTNLSGPAQRMYDRMRNDPRIQITERTSPDAATFFDVTLRQPMVAPTLALFEPVKHVQLERSSLPYGSQPMAFASEEEARRVLPDFAFETWTRIDHQKATLRVEMYGKDEQGSPLLLFEFILEDAPGPAGTIKIGPGGASPGLGLLPGQSHFSGTEWIKHSLIPWLQEHHFKRIRGDGPYFERLGFVRDGEDYVLDLGKASHLKNLRHRDPEIRRAAAEALQATGWSPKDPDDVLWFAIARKAWMNPALGSRSAAPAVLAAILDSDPQDRDIARFAWDARGRQWKTPDLLRWMSDRFHHPVTGSHFEHSTTRKSERRPTVPEILPPIKIHHEILPLLRERSQVLGGKILVLNLDSHNDYNLSEHLPHQTHSGNWGIRLESEGLGHYVWLPSYWSNYFHLKDDPHGTPQWEDSDAAQQIALQLQKDDVSEIWLTIDADSYSLRAVRDWEKPTMSLPPEFNQDSETIRRDLEHLRDFLDRYNLPIARIVIAESPGYLAKRPEEIPPFMKRLETITHEVFAAGPAVPSPTTRPSRALAGAERPRHWPWGLEGMYRQGRAHQGPVASALEGGQIVPGTVRRAYRHFRPPMTVRHNNGTAYGTAPEANVEIHGGQPHRQPETITNASPKALWPTLSPGHIQSITRRMELEGASEQQIHMILQSLAVMQDSHGISMAEVFTRAQIPIGPARAWVLEQLTMKLINYTSPFLAYLGSNGTVSPEWRALTDASDQAIQRPGVERVFAENRLLSEIEAVERLSNSQTMIEWTDLTLVNRIKTIVSKMIAELVALGYPYWIIGKVAGLNAGAFTNHMAKRIEDPEYWPKRESMIAMISTYIALHTLPAPVARHSLQEERMANRQFQEEQERDRIASEAVRRLQVLHDESRAASDASRLLADSTLLDLLNTYIKSGGNLESLNSRLHLSRGYLGKFLRVRPRKSAEFRGTDRLSQDLLQALLDELVEALREIYRDASFDLKSKTMRSHKAHRGSLQAKEAADAAFLNAANLLLERGWSLRRLFQESDVERNTVKSIFVGGKEQPLAYFKNRRIPSDIMDLLIRGMWRLSTTPSAPLLRAAAYHRFTRLRLHTRSFKAAIDATLDEKELSRNSLLNFFTELNYPMSHALLYRLVIALGLALGRFQKPPLPDLNFWSPLMNARNEIHRGSRIRHPRFGEGHITATEGDTLSVVFDTGLKLQFRASTSGMEIYSLTTGKGASTTTRTSLLSRGA